MEHCLFTWVLRTDWLKREFQQGKIHGCTNIWKHRVLPRCILWSSCWVEFFLGQSFWQGWIHFSNETTYEFRWKYLQLECILHVCPRCYHQESHSLLFHIIRLESHIRLLCLDDLLLCTIRSHRQWWPNQQFPQLRSCLSFLHHYHSSYSVRTWNEKLDMVMDGHSHVQLFTLHSNNLLQWRIYKWWILGHLI